MRAREQRRSVTPWLIGLGAAGALAYALTRPKVVGQITKVVDAINPSLLRRYLAMRPDIRAAAAEAGIPPEILAGTVRVESSYRNDGPIAKECTGIPCICSRVRAIGVAQILRATAAQVGYTGTEVGLCDVKANLKYSARYLKWLSEQLADPKKRQAGDDLWTAVHKAYNLGIGNYLRGRTYSGTDRYAAKAEATEDSLKQKGLAGLTFALAT